jgi:hypothetical protein
MKVLCLISVLLLVAAPVSAQSPGTKNDPCVSNSELLKTWRFVGRELNNKIAEREALYNQARFYQEQSIPGVSRLIAQLRTLDDELVDLQGLAGLDDIVLDACATGRFSSVYSHAMGREEGYYKLTPRSDGLYVETVDGRVVSTGISIYDVIQKGRVAFGTRH